MTSIPRPEHPRPNFNREPWHNLNGTWRFAFDPRLVGEQLNWYQPSQPKNLTITVPYPWESPLSGLAASDYKGAGWAGSGRRFGGKVARPATSHGKSIFRNLRLETLEQQQFLVAGDQDLNLTLAVPGLGSRRSTGRNKGAVSTILKRKNEKHPAISLSRSMKPSSAQLLYQMIQLMRVASSAITTRLIRGLMVT